MAILKVDTISGIGTEGPVFEGDIEFTSQNFLTLPKGDTTQRGRGRALIAGGSTPSVTSNINFLNMLGEVFRFNRNAEKDKEKYPNHTIEDYLQTKKYSEYFEENCN